MFEEYTRWNAEHTASITVRYQDNSIEEVTRDAAEYYGVTVYTTVWSVANAFSAKAEVCDKHAINKARAEASKRGDYVFYLWFGNHSAYSFGISEAMPPSDWDSGCCGILVCDKDKWPFQPKETDSVFKMVKDIFEDRVEAVMNGWVYEAIVDSEEDGCIGFTDFLSPEEALRTAQEEYPEIKYEDSDFETKYTLKGEKHDNY